MNMPSPEDLAAVPVLGAALAWVGRIHFKSKEHEKDIEDLRAENEASRQVHLEQTAKLGQLDGKVDAAIGSLTRIEARLDAMINARQ